MNDKRKALWALVLLVPVPSLGVTAGMILAPDTPLGKGLFFAAKLWILVLPLTWRLFVDQKRVAWSKPEHGGFVFGLLSGLLISAIVVGAFLVMGPRMIDPAVVKEMAGNVGLGTPLVYVGGAAYWILVNSVLEEYVWRWFVVEKCGAVMRPAWSAMASALAFTIHHVIALQVFVSPLTVLIASAGIFVGGAVWSCCYVRFKSIWPGYVSHAIVDVAVFATGYYLIFVA